MRPLVICLVYLVLNGCSTSSIPPDSLIQISHEQFHSAICRKDIPKICVHVDVTLNPDQVHAIVDRAQQYHTKFPQIIAVRNSEALAYSTQLPAIEVVSGKYTGYEHPKTTTWGAEEEVSRFLLDDSKWQYQDTVYPIYDPV